MHMQPSRQVAETLGNALPKFGDLATPKTAVILGIMRHNTALAITHPAASSQPPFYDGYTLYSVLTPSPTRVDPGPPGGPHVGTP